MAACAQPPGLGTSCRTCAGKRGRRAGKEAARRAAQSEMVQDLAAELAGAPEEVRSILAGRPSATVRHGGLTVLGKTAATGLCPRCLNSGSRSMLQS